MARHMLTDDDGRDVLGPVTYLDAYTGWVREIPSMWGAHNAEPVVLAPAVDPDANHTGHMGKHRRPLHRCAIGERTVSPVTFYVR